MELTVLIPEATDWDRISPSPSIFRSDTVREVSASYPVILAVLPL